MSTESLDKILVNQMTWKPSLTRSIAVAIVEHSLKCENHVWPDEVDFSNTGASKDDAGCFGTAWKNLKAQGIIEHVNCFRKSKAKHSNGRVIFGYALASTSRARTFLARNGGKPFNPQPNLL